MKLLLYIGIALAVYWWWRQSRLQNGGPGGENARPPGGPSAPPHTAPPPAPPLTMVSCATCGVHLPLSEAFADGPGGTEPFYCSPEHRRR